MKLSFVLAASFFVTGKASSPFDLKSSSELMDCSSTNCQAICQEAAQDAHGKGYDASKVHFTIEGKAPSCKCDFGKCCNAIGILHEANEKCFEDDGDDKCESGNKACCCYYYDSLDLKMKDKLKTDGPFLRAPVPELN